MANPHTSFYMAVRRVGNATEFLFRTDGDALPGPVEIATEIRNYLQMMIGHDVRRFPEILTAKAGAMVTYGVPFPNLLDEHMNLVVHYQASGLTTYTQFAEYISRSMAQLSGALYQRPYQMDLGENKRFIQSIDEANFAFETDICPCNSAGCIGMLDFANGPVCMNNF